MNIPRPLLVCLLAALPALGFAQVYQWKDAGGRTVISDTPPPGNAQGSRRIGGATPSVSTEAAPAPAPAPKSMAEKDMEFRQRQQENREKADKEAKEKAAAAERKDNCERTRRQLALLESGMRISSTDEKGERRFMEDAERQREIERTRRQVNELCK